MMKSGAGVFAVACCLIIGCSESNLEDAETQDENSSDQTGGTGSGENGSSSTSPAGTGEGMLSGDCPQAAHFLDIEMSQGAGGNYPDPTLSVTCMDDYLLVEGNGIPHYTFVQTTPNALTAANHAYQIPLNPQVADASTDIPLLGFVGVAVNGAPFFGPNEGGIPQAEQFGDPVYNNDNSAAAADGSGTLMDGCLGHTANEYHYHALLDICLTPESLNEDPWFLSERDTTLPSPIVGYAADGFPVYGRYGCLDEDCAEVVEFKSSWDMTGDPTTFAWDAYTFNQKNDEQYLDRCNGRIGPDGTYRYHETAGFPYILGCFTGTATGAGAEEGGGMGGGPGTGGPGGDMDCEEGETERCCGDGVCDGPETADICPEDCA
ncbi:MAG: YHYH protein [Deltaproteobacteria bacterium]|nr:YHYH protein [Deltaproteobacteria bacterium]